MSIRINIWKCLLISLPVFMLITSFKQNNDQKFWDKTSPLTWDDFKKVNKPDNYDAKSSSNTFLGELYRYKRLASDSNTYVFAFKVQSVMIHSMSYVDPQYKNAALLAHEQLHFDISEYFARQLLLAFQKGVYTKNFRNEIKDIKQKNTVQRNAMENLYDEQTDHSRNIRMQSKWNVYVQSLLQNNESLENALKKLP